MAAFFVVGAYFALGTGRRTATAAALGLALGIGTKISGPLLLSLFVLVVIAGRRRTLLENGAIIGAGLVGGSAWYILNVVHTGSIDGGLAADTNQIPGRGPVDVTWRAFRLTLDAFELPGASGSNICLYVVCAVAFLIAAGVARRVGGNQAGPVLMAAVLTVAIPALVLASSYGLTTIWHSWWRFFGRSGTAESVPAYEAHTLSDSAVTWFGTSCATLVLLGFFLTVGARTPDRLLRIALAAAPMIFVAVVAFGLTYDPWA